MDITPLQTVDEAAAALRLSPRTIRCWIGTRRIGVVRIGRAVRIPASEVERLVVGGRCPALGSPAEAPQPSPDVVEIR